MKAHPDQTMIRLTDMANETCIVALDKTIHAFRLVDYHKSHAAAADQCSWIAERMTRAVRELCACI